MPGLVLIRGGGDLASGVALRLHRAGLRVVITELPEPLVVRRLAAFAQAVFTGRAVVEGVVARRIDEPGQVEDACAAGEIPVLVDPRAESRRLLNPLVFVDGRMAKRAPELGLETAPLVVGLGPGFSAGRNCHAAVETQRGHYLGRVIWQGEPLPDTGVPESSAAWSVFGPAQDINNLTRVLRSPVAGTLTAHADIADHLEDGQPVAEVGGQVIRAPFRGVLRGLLYPGLWAEPGMKIGDLDPRDDPRLCSLVSDKSLAVGGGVLEAILALPEVRRGLWEQP